MAKILKQMQNKYYEYVPSSRQIFKRHASIQV